MVVMTQITDLVEAFHTIAKMVKKDPEDTNAVIKGVQHYIDLLSIYEEAICQNVDPHEAVEMRDLAKVLVDYNIVEEHKRQTEMNELDLRSEARIAEQPRFVLTDAYREKLRKEWETFRPDVIVVDMPFTEYAEEFVEYLAGRLESLRKESE